MSLNTLVRSFADPLVVDQAQCTRENAQNCSESEESIPETLETYNTISVREVIPADVAEQGQNKKNRKSKRAKKSKTGKTGKKSAKISTAETELSDSMRSTFKHTLKQPHRKTSLDLRKSAKGLFKDGKENGASSKEARPRELSARFGYQPDRKIDEQETKYVVPFFGPVLDFALDVFSLRVEIVRPGAQDFADAARLLSRMHAAA